MFSTITDANQGATALLWKPGSCGSSSNGTQYLITGFLVPACT